MAKLDFVPYNTSPLSSSVVGSPGADQSGLIGATSELQDGAAVASTNLAAQNHAASVENSLTTQGVNNAQQTINAVQRAKAQAAKDLAAHNEALRKETAKALADNIGSDYELKAARRIKQIFSRPEIKANPDSAPGTIDKELADLYDELPEMDQEVGNIVNKKYNDVRVAGGKAGTDFQETQRLENAKNAVVNADARRVDYAVSDTNGDVTQLKGLVSQVDQSMGGREFAQGAEKAKETATKNKEEMGKKFLLLAVENAPHMMPAYLSDDTIKEIVPEDERNKFDEKAKARVKALESEANKAATVQLTKERNNNFQLYLSAYTSDNEVKMRQTLDLFTGKLDEFSKDTTSNDEIRKQENDYLAWAKDIRARLEHKEAIARMQQNEANANKRAAVAEINADKRAAAALAVEKEKQAKLDALQYLTTEDAQKGRGQAYEAYQKVRGLPNHVKYVSSGTDQERKDIIAAMNEMRRAYNSGQLGYKLDKSTVDELNEKMTYLSRRLEMNELKRTHAEGSNLWNAAIKQLQGLITHHEAANPPVPKAVSAVLNPTGDKKVQKAVELQWADDHPKEVAEYKRQNGIDPTVPLKMVEYKFIMDAHAAKKITQANK